MKTQNFVKPLLTFPGKTHYSNSRMKRIATLLALVYSFAAAAPAYAMSICPAGSSFSNLCKLNQNKVGSAVGVVIQVLLVIAIISCVFFLIWGGIRWIASGGDKGKVDQARGTLTAAVVGLVIALLSFFILNVILIVVTGKGITTLTIPTLL